MNKVEKCKCHGMSGSCAFQSCFYKVAPFRSVGDQLLLKYEAASPVKLGNDNPSSLWSPISIAYGELPTDSDDEKDGRSTMQRRSVPQSNLIFTERSPNFCERNRQWGVIGVRGRQCHPSGGHFGSCDQLCCGRSYQPDQLVVQEINCNCRFHYCCVVKCKTCRNVTQTYKCR